MLKTFKMKLTYPQPTAGKTMKNKILKYYNKDFHLMGPCSPKIYLQVTFILSLSLSLLSILEALVDQMVARVSLRVNL
jgi:hypothetical protein